jgi:glycosyltransferase involved in cell wall biosynthesis
VLFYGTYIPLHGIPTIVDAAQELARDPVHFVLIGNGQLRPDIDARLRAAGAVDVEQLGMVPIERLADEIARAQVCLGIFGASGKAARVVPNKVFQCAAMGKAIVTADTPATREAFGAAVATVPAGDAHALAECLRELVAAPERCEQLGARARATYEERFSAARLTEMLDAALTRATQSAGRST